MEIKKEIQQLNKKIVRLEEVALQQNIAIEQSLKEIETSIGLLVSTIETIMTHIGNTN